jgi:hypothetical protein
LYASAHEKPHKSSVVTSEINVSHETTPVINIVTVNEPDESLMDEEPICNYKSMNGRQSSQMIQYSTPAYQKKKKMQGLVSAREVRHNRRIAGQSIGYKDKDATDAADDKMDIVTEENQQKSSKKNLNSEFEVEIIDNSTPPP